MGRFQLSGKALKDLAAIVAKFHSGSGPTYADLAEERFFSAFQRLADGRAVGHRRVDLTEKNVSFYMVPPHLVVYRQGKGLVTILRVLHGAQDIAKLL